MRARARCRSAARIGLGMDRRRHDMHRAAGAISLRNRRIRALAGRISVTPSARSPITATVSSRPGTISLDHHLVRQGPALRPRAARLSPLRTMKTPTHEPSLTGFTTKGGSIRSPRRELARGRPRCFRRPAGRRRRRRPSPSACAWRAPRPARRNGCRECAAARAGPGRAVLAAAAVQRVEHRVGRRRQRGDERARGRASRRSSTTS